MQRSMERRRQNLEAQQREEASGRWMSTWLPRSPLEAKALAMELSPEGQHAAAVQCTVSTSLHWFLSLQLAGRLHDTSMVMQEIDRSPPQASRRFAREEVAQRWALS